MPRHGYGWMPLFIPWIPGNGSAWALRLPTTHRWQNTTWVCCKRRIVYKMKSLILIFTWIAVIPFSSGQTADTNLINKYKPTMIEQLDSLLSEKKFEAGACGWD